jgi:flagellar hook assembly protein FlgD
VTGFTAIENKDELATEFRLFQNYPNPFNPSTNITYSLAVNSHVRLTIYNLLGQKICTLVDNWQNPGIQSVVWNGQDKMNQQVPGGVYFYKLESGTISKIKKMVLLK